MLVLTDKRCLHLRSFGIFESFRFQIHHAARPFMSWFTSSCTAASILFRHHDRNEALTAPDRGFESSLFYRSGELVQQQLRNLMGHMFGCDTLKVFYFLGKIPLDFWTNLPKMVIRHLRPFNTVWFCIFLWNFSKEMPLFFNLQTKNVHSYSQLNSSVFDFHPRTGLILASKQAWRYICVSNKFHLAHAKFPFSSFSIILANDKFHTWLFPARLTFISRSLIHIIHLMVNWFVVYKPQFQMENSKSIFPMWKNRPC